MPPKKVRDDDEVFVESAPRISFNDLEKSMTPFTDDDAYGIEAYIKEFEDIATLMQWSEIEKLIYSKRLQSETHQQFFLHLKEIAVLGNIEDEALIEYVIDDIRDVEANKPILYGTKNLTEFRKKLDLYAEIKKKSCNVTKHQIYSKPSTSKGQR